MRAVLDTSAFFSMEDVGPGVEAFTTASVLAELEKFGDRRSDFLRHKVLVTEPTGASMKKVKEASRQTGDSSRLSLTDQEVLACALDLGGEIWTDDYSIQNMARKMGIPYRPVGLKGIRQLVHWRYKCTSCGHTMDKEQPDCPICGGAVRTTRSKK
ncbi:MAG TPA: nucleic acid-binding protein [Methanomassiliicoccales archaeon]|nr:nucleic acid-binding protein [Methanomassiliicoccales archaeon]